jgi:hypothetical protein
MAKISQGRVHPRIFMSIVTTVSLLVLVVAVTHLLVWMKNLHRELDPPARWCLVKGRELLKRLHRPNVDGGPEGTETDQPLEQDNQARGQEGAGTLRDSPASNRGRRGNSRRH